VTAGLATLQAEGLDGLTMARVADRLAVKPASLYWHVRNKEELLDLLADAMFSALDLSRCVKSDDWRSSLTTIVRAMRHHLLGYRDSARLVTGRFTTGPGQLRNIETMLGVLRAAGLSNRDTAYTTFLLTTFLIGFVGGEQAPLSAAVSAGRSARAHLDTLHHQFAALSKEEFPHTVELAAEMTEPNLDSRFEFALERLLDGVDALRHDRPEPRS
jgi:TetR/AcrR family tetracycline transcriptional repressor